MNATKFRTLFEILHNVDLDALEQAGVVTPGAKGGSDWKRFNSDLTTFVLKLPADRLAKLAAMVEAEEAAEENRTEAAWERQQESLMESGSPDDSSYRRDMINAGRGHLLK